MEKTGRATEDNVAVLLETAELFERMPDGVQKTNLAVEMFGRSGLNMIPMLNQGRDGITELMAEAERLGVVIDGRTAKAAEEFNDQLTKLRAGGRGLIQDVVGPLLPMLIDMAEGFRENLKTVRELAAALPGGGLGGWMGKADFIRRVGVETMSDAFVGMMGGLSLDEQEKFWDMAERIQRVRDEMADDVSGSSKTDKEPATIGKQRLQEILKDLELQGGRSQLRMAEMLLRPASQFDGFNRRDLLMTEIALQQDLLGKRARLISTSEMELGLISEIEAAEMALGVEREKQALAEQRRAFEWLGFRDVMLDGLDQLQFEWADLGGNSAAVALDSIQLGVQGVGDAIMGAITGTKTWGQVFSQVGQQIIANLINLVVQWIAQMTIVNALKRILGIQDSTMAAQMAVSWAPAAIAASVASYGAAAAVGTAAYAAALATGTGLTAGLSFGGAREHGGPVEPGKMYLTGERGREFFVPDQRGTIIPAGLTERMMAGNLAPSFTAAAPNISVKSPPVIMVNSERELFRRAMDYPEFTNAILETWRQHKLQFGSTT
jgi:hypothetical protein